MKLSARCVWLVMMVLTTLALARLYAGPLDPPAGPVQPTMHTLEDIYQQLSGSSRGAYAVASIAGIAGDVNYGGIVGGVEVTDGGIVGVNASGTLYQGTREFVLGVRKGKASPTLLQRASMQSGQPTIPTVEIRIYTLQPDGSRIHTFTTTLTNVGVRRMFGHMNAEYGSGSGNSTTFGIGLPGAIDLDWIILRPQSPGASEITYTSVTGGTTATAPFN